MLGHPFRCIEIRTYLTPVQERPPDWRICRDVTFRCIDVGCIAIVFCCVQHNRDPDVESYSNKFKKKLSSTLSVNNSNI